MILFKLIKVKKWVHATLFSLSYSLNALRVLEGKNKHVLLSISVTITTCDGLLY